MVLKRMRGLTNKNKIRYMQAGGVACYIHKSLTSEVLFMSKISNITKTELVPSIGNSFFVGTRRIEITASSRI